MLRVVHYELKEKPNKLGSAGGLSRRLVPPELVGAVGDLEVGQAGHGIGGKVPVPAPIPSLDSADCGSRRKFRQ